VSISPTQYNPSLQIMAMIVVVAIDAKLFGSTRAKHRDKFRVHRHHFRRAGAADVVVQTQHFVGFCHHQMQVVRNHQHRAVKLMAKLINQIVQRNLAIHVNTLSRFIEDQQLRATQ
jgi:predicted nuclease with RNAse H fold